MKSPYLLQSTESVALWVYLWFRCLSNEGRHMSNFTETVQPLDPVAQVPLPRQRRKGCSVAAVTQKWHESYQENRWKDHVRRQIV